LGAITSRGGGGNKPRKKNGLVGEKQPQAEGGERKKGFYEKGMAPTHSKIGPQHKASENKFEPKKRTAAITFKG